MEEPRENAVPIYIEINMSEVLYSEIVAEIPELEITTLKRVEISGNKPETKLDSKFEEKKQKEAKKETERKQRRERKTARRKPLAVRDEKENENQNWGHLLLPRMIEFWRNMHQLSVEILNPLISKGSPFGKMHFSVQVYWYLISSIYLPRNIAKLETDMDRVTQKIIVQRRKESGFIHILSKGKMADSQKKISDAADQEKGKLCVKALLVKRTKNRKMMEAIIGYLNFKNSLLEIQRKENIEKTNCLEFLGGKENKEASLIEMPGEEIKRELDLSLRENKEGRVGQLVESKVNQNMEILKCNELEIRRQEETNEKQVSKIGTINWRDFSGLKIKLIEEVLNGQQHANKSKIESLLKKTEERKKMFEIQNRHFSKIPVKKIKRDNASLFCNTVKETDVLFHYRSFYRIDEKYLKKIEDNVKSTLSKSNGTEKGPS